MATNPASYRPRKKRKSTALFAGSNNSLTVDAGEGKPTPAFPLVSFQWGARAGVSQWLVLPLTLMAVGLFRWAVSLWGYSGEHSVGSRCLVPL
jgi:alpha-1,3-glucosyltransferase